MNPFWMFVASRRTKTKMKLQRRSWFSVQEEGANSMISSVVFPRWDSVSSGVFIFFANLGMIPTRPWRQDKLHRRVRWHWHWECSRDCLCIRCIVAQKGGHVCIPLFDLISRLKSQGLLGLSSNVIQKFLIAIWMHECGTHGDELEALKWSNDISCEGKCMRWTCFWCFLHHFVGIAWLQEHPFSTL